MLKFIVNPNAGGAKGYEAWEIAKIHLDKKKIPYEMRLTNGPGDATAIAREYSASDEPVTIVAVGGDGTFNEMLNGLSITPCLTVGYIPTGSGNDLARGLGFSGSIVKNVDRILACKNIFDMDYGVLSYGSSEVINRRFAVSCGIGYDAGVCLTLDNSNLRRQLAKVKLQKSAYLILGVTQVLKDKPSVGYVILDGTRKVEFNDIMFVSAHNHKTEGGGKNFAPKASACDGLLTLCIMHTKSKITFTRNLLEGIKGNHLKYEGVRSYDCKSVKIHVDRPLVIHTDGEIVGFQSDIEIQCVEKKLRMIV